MIFAWFSNESCLEAKVHITPHIALILYCVPSPCSNENSTIIKLTQDLPAGLDVGAQGLSPQPGRSTGRDGCGEAWLSCVPEGLQKQKVCLEKEEKTIDD